MPARKKLDNHFMPFSARLSARERGMIRELQSKLQLDNSKIVRQAIRLYYEAVIQGGNTAYDTSLTSLINFVGTSLQQRRLLTNVMQHPLSVRVSERGIKVHDDDGSNEVELRSLEELLDFVENRVLYEVS